MFKFVPTFGKDAIFANVPSLKTSEYIGISTLVKKL